MKSKSTVLAIVGFLVGSAVGLGVMHMIRTDRRAKTVADSLNRSVTPNRSLKQEGPFAVSKSEPGPTDAIKQATTPTVRGPMSLDLKALQAAVLAGDAAGVHMFWRKVEPGDEVVIHSLLYKIPSTADEETRRWIKSSLMQMLRRAKGDEADRLLLATVMHEDLLPSGEWSASVYELGNRRYKAARSFLDGVAFGDGKGDIKASTCALIQIEPYYYLSRTGQAITASEGDKLWDYVAALERSAVENDIDIAAEVPILKAKFLDASTPWGYRTRLARALERYSRQWNSTVTRAWLTNQLDRIVALPKAQAPPAWDVSICRELLGLLRGSETSDSK